MGQRIGITTIWCMFACLYTTTSTAQQSPPPDLWEEGYSGDYTFIQNAGQLLRSDKNPASEILYYTNSSLPLQFFQPDKISFVSLEQAPESTGMHSWYRIDLEFECLPETGCTPSLTAIDPKSFVNHYFLTHTGTQGITEVPNYQRLIYESAFPNIDVHFFSNANGPKLAFVIHPGGDPNDIRLKLNGQDKIEVLQDGLKASLANWDLLLSHFIAYEVDPQHNTHLLPWLASLQHWGNGELSFQTSNFNSGNTLVLLMGLPEDGSRSGGPQNCWSTYIGSFGDFDEVNDMLLGLNGYLYVTGSAGAPDFPIFPGQSAFDGSLNALTDAFISYFDDDGVLLWTTFVGGSLDENGRSLVQDQDGEVYFTVETNSHDLLLICDSTIGQFCQGYSHPAFSGMAEGYIGKMSVDGENQLYGSYLGGNSFDFLPKGGAYVDQAKNWTLVGHTESTDFPLQTFAGAYNQDIAGQQTGFIFQLDANCALQWSSFWGGSGQSEILGLVGKSTGELIIAGTTTTFQVGDQGCAPATNGGFPLCDPTGAQDYYQESGARLYIAEFSDNRQLVWSTFFGEPGAFHTNYGGLALDPNDHLYLYGSTGATQFQPMGTAPVVGQGFPLSLRPGAYNQTSNSGGQELFLSRFDADRNYDWGFLWGGSGDDFGSGIALDANSNLYLSGATFSTDFSTNYKWGFYYQGQQGNLGGISDTDPFVLGFDGDGQNRWSTYYGGEFTSNNRPNNNRQNERSNVLLSEPNGTLYMGGITTGKDFPYQCDPSTQYCRNTPQFTNNVLDDGFLVRFEIDQLLGWDERAQLENSVVVFPNPAKGQFTINWSGVSTSPDRAVIITPTGQVLLERELGRLGNQTTIEIPRMAASGLYLIQLYSDQGIHTSKLMVR
ncbi:MAG: T9SS type A sorting domain-containing protein [Salibacteraceae bacterium]